jgi:hypothetical protein
MSAICAEGRQDLIVRMCIPLKLVSAKNRKIQTRSGKVFKNPEVKAFEREDRE